MSSYTDKVLASSELLKERGIKNLQYDLQGSQYSKTPVNMFAVNGPPPNSLFQNMLSTKEPRFNFMY